jgi:phosphatidylglycerophosphatase C
MIEKRKKDKPVVAAFDFDGTITYCDSTFLFLIFVKGYVKSFLLLLTKIPLLAAFIIGKATRQETKESMFKTFFRGKSEEDINQLGERFAKTKLPRYIRPKAKERIQWHQKQGHHCILVSASISAYLEPWAKVMGFKNVLASNLEVDEKGNVTGKLQGLNCRREEKIQRLKELLGPLEDYKIYAYGDSEGDKEMLEAADMPFYRTFPSEQ